MAKGGSYNQLGAQKVMAGIGSNIRTGSPDEIASIALFLALDDSSLVYGTTLVAEQVGQLTKRHILNSY